jgi:hypothetical protein
MSIKQIQNDYLNLNKPGSYTGISTFMKARNYKDKNKVKLALQQLEGYSLNKRVRNKFSRRRTRTFFPFYQIGLDLVTIGKLKSKKSPYTQILLCVSNFSRFAW